LLQGIEDAAEEKTEKTQLAQEITKKPTACLI
jgi:hypothetical protein